jgi:hypothetical protein
VKKEKLIMSMLALAAVSAGAQPGTPQDGGLHKKQRARAVRRTLAKQRKKRARVRKGKCVTCVRDNGVPLTQGQVYLVRKVVRGRVGVMNDHGQIHNYPADRFEVL